MMNQLMYPLYGVGDPKVSIIAGRWAIGSTGAVGAKSGGKGMTLTRNDVGKYTVQLVDADGTAASVPVILFASAAVFNSDLDASDDTDAHDVRLGAVSDSAGTLVLQAVDEALVAREIPSGASIAVVMFIKNSSLVR